MRTNLCIYVATVLAFGGALLPAHGATAIVNGNANLNLAGRANGYSCCSGDSAPAQSPTLVSGLSLVAGDALTFSVSGEVSYSGAASGRNNPDGSPYAGVPRNFGDGISAPTNLNRVDALVGLFLGTGSPTGATTPAQINNSGGLNFASSAPQLGQIFFIGNGRSGDTHAGDFGGAVQTFIVPAGATRLYLGTTDGYGWYNNNGSFIVDLAKGVDMHIPEAPLPPTSTAESTPQTLPPKSLPPLPELNQDMQTVASAYEYAMLAKAVYDGLTPVEINTLTGKSTWRLLDRQVQQIAGFDLGFNAATYMRRDGPNEWVCAIVFAGTNVADAIDWANNISQAVTSISDEYERGANYAASITKGVCRDRKTYLVGHSLGGGIAQYAFLKTGALYPTRTFNTAGLSIITTTLYWRANMNSSLVQNFVANPMNAEGTAAGLAIEPASVVGEHIGRKVLVPMYAELTNGVLRISHLIAPLAEAIGVQLDYCLAAAGKCH